MRKSFVRSILLSVVLAVVHLAASAQQAKRYNSLLWRITGPDLPAPSYLYGTMHVSNKLAFNLTEEFFQSFESCQDVAMEMDPDVWLPEMTHSQLFAMLYGMQMRMRGGSDLYGDAFELDPPGRESLREVLSQDPALVNDLLYRMTQRGADHEENTFLDLFIYQCARKRDKPVHGLEEFEPTMELMIKASAAEDEDREKEKHARRRMQDFSGTDPIKAMEDAYRIGDLDRIDTLMDVITPSKASRKIMLDQRNRNFINGMLPIMRQRSLFTAVGAAHLPGDSGMVQMLRHHGYTVEAVLGKTSSRANSQSMPFIR